jgi:hypothetical protein
MDPLLFNIDGETVTTVISTIAMLSIFIERALSIVFEWRPVVDRLEKWWWLKEPITFFISLYIVWFSIEFDALAIIFRNETKTLIGCIVTAAMIAGGCKGSVKLFRDLLDWKSSAYRELIEKNRKAQKLPGDSTAPVPTGTP